MLRSRHAQLGLLVSLAVVLATGIRPPAAQTLVNNGLDSSQIAADP
jgi:hypothetical protein